MLRAACANHRPTAIETTWLDSVRVAKRAWPELQSHRLNALTRFLSVPHKHHDALSDARAAGIVVVRAIEHTGIGLAGWISPGHRHLEPAPKAAPSGALKGERVAILGTPRDSQPARLLAAAGARVMSRVGATTTGLVISEDQPFGCFVHAHAEYRLAEELRRSGSTIGTVSEFE